MNNLVYKIDLSKMPDILWVGKTNELPPWRHNGRKMGYHHFAVLEWYTLSRVDKHPKI